MNLLDKSPSFDLLFKSALATFGRFPLTLVSAIIGSVAAFNMVDSSSDGFSFQQRILMAAALGLPLFTALVFFGEKRNWSKARLLVVQGVGALALIGYFFTLPADDSFESLPVVRFLLLNIGLHFLVAILPYLGGKQTNGFWTYNKSLFLRFLTAALYSGVLYIGLTIALASADQLFGIKVDSERYFEMWIVITGVFNTWLFLAGVPRNLAELDSLDDYPKGLKLLTQYILLPLVVLYLLILFAYEAKIIVTWNWPKGWVSNLVLWYSVVGILSLLLLHPLKDRAESRWIAVFSRWFFRALIPLVAMLFLAILRRISDYGITENRYFVMAMAIGLAIVVLYFVFSKVKDIRIIPIIICAIAFLSAYGPWGAFSVSLKSQQSRLERLLVDNNLWPDVAIQDRPDDIALEQRREMSSIISYLARWHGLESFSRWVDESTLNEMDSLSHKSQSEKIAPVLGFDYVANWRYSAAGEYLSYHTSGNKPVSVAGYDYLVEFHSARADATEGDTLTFHFDDRSSLVWFDEDLAYLSIQSGDSGPDDNVIEFALLDRIKSLRDSSLFGKLSADKLTLSASATGFDVRVILNRVTGRKKSEGIELTRVAVQLLIRFH